MKKTIAFLIAAIVLMASSLCLAAGSSVTQTYATIKNSNTATLTLDWVSDDGDGSATAAVNTANMAAIKGMWLVKVRCVPSQAAAKPTTLYDVTITDANGLDIMGGTLADRTIVAGGDQAVPLTGAVYGPTPITDTISLNVTNAGNSKTGSVILYLTR